MHNVKSRGNGQGTAFKRGKTWVARVVIGWRIPDNPKNVLIPIYRSKGGFKTKKEAPAPASPPALPRQQNPYHSCVTMRQCDRYQHRIKYADSSSKAIGNMV